MNLGVVVSVAAALTGCALDPASDTADETSQTAALTVQDGRTTPCPDGSLCLYERPDHSGMMVVVEAGANISDLRTIPCPECTKATSAGRRTFSAQASSWDNRSAMPSCYYDKPGFTGTPHPIPAYASGNVQAGGDAIASLTSPGSPSANVEIRCDPQL